MIPALMNYETKKRLTHSIGGIIMTNKTTKTTKKNNTKTATKKNTALKKNLNNLKSSSKKISGLVSNILGKTEGAISDLVVSAKRRLRS